MSDKFLYSTADQSIVFRCRDMGDGTYAQIGAVAAPVAQSLASAQSTGNASAAASLSAKPGLTNYLTGFEITSGGATAAALALVTIVGLLGGTLTYVLGVVAGVAAANAPLLVTFNPPLPASAVNTAITLTVPALGSGNTQAAIVMHGFAQ